jgi:tRNA(fMet)-specific endonuclease VapC
MDIILDTSVIIEIFGGNEQVYTYLSRYKDAVFGITAITEFELNCVDLKEKEVIMLHNLPTRDFDKAAGRIGGHIFRALKKAGKMPKLKDLLIAATCIAHTKRLLTTDSDFEMFQEFGLTVEVI